MLTIIHTPLCVLLSIVAHLKHASAHFMHVHSVRLSTIAALSMCRAKIILQCKEICGCHLWAIMADVSAIIIFTNCAFYTSTVTGSDDHSEVQLYTFKPEFRRRITCNYPVHCLRQ